MNNLYKAASERSLFEYMSCPCPFRTLIMLSPNTVSITQEDGKKKKWDEGPKVAVETSGNLITETQKGNHGQVEERK